VKWNQSGAEVAVRQITDFPRTEETELVVHASKPVEFTVGIRVPGWLARPMAVELNGENIPVQGDQKHWARFRKIWRDGDRLKITLPMGFRVSRLTASGPFPAAVQYGPVTLAFSSAAAGRQVDMTDPARSLRRDPGRALAWTLSADPSVLARPFYDVPSAEKYFVYLAPGLGDLVSRRMMTFTGQWRDAGSRRISNAVGATAEASFEGTSVRWLGRRYDDAGKAEITIDDKVVGVVDQYGPGRDLPFDWTYKGLSPGKHVIRLRVLEDKAQQSRDGYVNVSGFEVFSEDEVPPAATTSPR
jgi:hypothetical protein